MERLTKREKGTNRINCDNCGSKGNCMIPNTCLCEITDRLAAYEDAEEQGLLVRLPCKVGDTVYAIIPSPFGKSWVAKGKITRFGYWGDGLSCNVTYKHFGECTMLGWFGDDVFLTREEAEAALKGEGKDV